MLQFSRLQSIGIALIMLLGALFAAPNLMPESVRASLPGIFPKGTINLGLDLQGGSHLLLSVDTKKVVDDRMKAMMSDIRRELRPNRTANRDRISLESLTYNEAEGVISLRLGDAAQQDDAVARIRSLTGGGVGGALGLGMRSYTVDAEEGRILITMAPEARQFYANEAVRDSIEVVRRRIDPAGNKEVLIAPQGADRIVVQVPGDNDPEALKELINRTGQLSFHRQDTTVSLEDAMQGILPGNRIYVPCDEDACGGVPGLVLNEDAEVTGDMVQNASATQNNDQGGFQINFEFDQRGARRFADYTRNNIGAVFAIVLDNKIISAPRIQSAITGGSGRITGDFSAQEAEKTALLIRSGALPAELKTIEQRSVGSQLGKDSVEAGTKALIIGFLAVIVYMIVTYGRFGVYADIALMGNVVLIAGALSLFGSTLTLPGMAGIVLTIGMAVDANVLIFERIREELLGGKPPIKAAEIGYEKAWSAILDANVTTFLAALIMFQLGAGPVRGFAVTLAVGVVTSVFTAYVLTRMMAGGYLLSKRPKEIRI
ncbi:MAG: protein translocase subunit SecD [Parvularculaceae bacterium]